MAGPHKMKAYASFDEFQADQVPKHRTILRALRKLVREVEPTLTEGVKWGNGCWLGPAGPVAYAHPDAEKVEFGFFSGASLDDPHGLLRGKGKFIRHVPIVSVADIDERALSALLREAAAIGHPRGSTTAKRPAKARRGSPRGP